MSRPSGDALRKQIRGHIQEENDDKEIKAKESQNGKLWVPSGSVLFNLACSDQCSGAYLEGRMINLVGDSSSGKSFLALSGMAAMANNEKYADYELIYDDAEFADSFDHSKLFGESFCAKVKPPSIDEETKEPVFSSTIEQFFDHVMDAVDSEKPFIYILDSFDAIDADAEIAKELENREHRKKGNLSKIKGSFQATKQKKASQMFRQICGKLSKTKSILIIISQTRDNLDAFSFVKQYRAGGKALKFYSSIEAWLTYAGAITKTVAGISHKIGVKTIIKISKNKFTGKLREVGFPIYYDYGIDDIESCLEFLLVNKYWAKPKQTITATELNVEMTQPKLIQYIEENGKEQILFAAVQTCWEELEEKLKLNRKRKF